MTDNTSGFDKPLTLPLKVGLIGTGYAAQRRAETLNDDRRTQLFLVNGHTQENTEAFCQTYSVSPSDNWQSIVTHSEIDLVIIANINCEHAAIARAALLAGKHVILEYPLAFSTLEAKELITLAQQNNKLLHVEHIELLGGLHQAIRQKSAEIGQVFSARYATITPQRSVPRRWTYNRKLFGFPLIAALSRVHRLTNLFGTVASVSCQLRYWDAPEEDYFLACLCETQLRFNNGLIAQLTYGKGEVFWKGDRTFELHGDRGSLVFEGETGNLIRDNQQIPVEVGSRRGLFAKDTQMVLAHLFNNEPLYVTPQESLYALEVAQAAYQSSLSGKTIHL